MAIAAQSDEHINVLRRLTRLMQDEARLQQLFTCTDPALLIASLSDDAPVATSTIAAQDLEQRVEWTVDYPNGLHARPASIWAATARQFDATIQIRHDNEVADAKKLTKLLQLGLRNGDRLVISANGPQSAAALSALCEIMIQLTSQELANAAAAQNNAHQAEQPDEASASAAPGIPDIAAP